MDLDAVPEFVRRGVKTPTQRDVGVQPDARLAPRGLDIPDDAWLGTPSTRDDRRLRPLESD